MWNQDSGHYFDSSIDIRKDGRITKRNLHFAQPETCLKIFLSLAGLGTWFLLHCN